MISFFGKTASARPPLPIPHAPPLEFCFLVRPVRGGIEGPGAWFHGFSYRQAVARARVVWPAFLLFDCVLAVPVPPRITAKRRALGLTDGPDTTDTEGGDPL